MRALPWLPAAALAAASVLGCGPQPSTERESRPAVEPEHGNGSVFVLEFEGPVEEGWKTGVAATGAELLDYVPDFSFVVRIPPGRRAEVAAAPHVVGLRPYRAADHRNHAALLTAAPWDLVQVRVVLFDDIHPTGLIARVNALGGTVDETVWNPWISFLDVTVPSAAAGSVAHWPEVRHLEDVLEFTTSNKESRPTIQSGNYVGGSTLTAAGLDGAGQIVTVMDSGLDRDHGMFAQSSSVVGAAGAGHRKVAGYAAYGGNLIPCDVDDHGTHVSGTVAGNASEIGLDGQGDGVAPAARLIMQDVKGNPANCTTPNLSIPANLATALADAHAAGSRIHNDSWGSNTNVYSAHADQMDGFMWTNKDFLLVVAAGNSGPGASTLGTPGTAKNVVTVGAHDADPKADFMADFSSRGPAVPGGSNRRKPTITAPGTDTTGTADTGAGTPGIQSAASDADTAGITTPFLSISGTSMASPATAGAAALVRQYFLQGRYPTGAIVPANTITPSAALTRAILMNSARNMSSAAARPSNDQGFGRVVLEDALYRCGESRNLFVDDASRLATGASKSYQVTVDGSAPLQVSLAWTDRAGDFLVNDLDLTVTTGATTWKGSVFSGGWSATGGAADRVNPDEGIFLAAPAPGVYTVTVTGFNVPMGETDAKQPYALAISGNLSVVDGATFQRAPAVVTNHGPFDSARSGDATPALSFRTTDPNGDAITYDVQWSADAAFGTSTTRTVGPVASNTWASYTLTAGEALAAGTWYWRVRARDAAGSGCNAEWGAVQSYTVQTGRTVDGWFQTTQAQFQGSTFSNTTAAVSGVEVAFAGTTNLSLTATASATGSFDAANYPPANVRDGVVSTIWAGNTPSSVQVDLGSVRSLDRVELDFDLYVADNTPGDFTVGASNDDVSYTTVFTQVDGVANTYTVDFTPRQTARYLRLTITQSASGGAGPVVVGELRAFEALTTGTFTSESFRAADASNGGWSQYAFTQTTTGGGSIVHRLEHFNGSVWALVPNAELAGNSTGFTTSPVDLTGLSATTYPELRTVVSFTAGTTSPVLTSIAFEVLAGTADTEPPVIAPHADVVAEATSAAGATVAYTAPATSDNVDPAGVASCVPASGSMFPLGATTVSCNASDAAMNAAAATTFVVTVEDSTPPLIAAHADVTVEATGASGAIAVYTSPATTDAVDGAGTASCAPASGTLFPLGGTTVTCNASDAAANAAIATTFLVTVADTTGPVIAFHLDVVAEATGATGAVVGYAVPATSDAVDGAGTASCLPAPGSLFALGDTTVNCTTANDAAGNPGAPTSFLVSVQDTTAPVIAAHADVAAEATSAAGAVVAYASPATSDAVDGAGSAVCLPASGTTFALGGTIVTCNAADAASNAAIATTFLVTVQDATAPVIAAHAAETAEATSAAGAIVSYASPATSDAVDGAGTASCLPASGTTFALGGTTVTCSASDAASNAATPTTFTVTVQDTTPPVIASHPDVQSPATSPAGGVVSYASPATSDLVDGDGTAACLPASGSLFAFGTTAVTCNASDAASNAAAPTTFDVQVIPAAPAITVAVSPTSGAIVFQVNDPALVVVTPPDPDDTVASIEYQLFADVAIVGTSTTAIITFLQPAAATGTNTTGTLDNLDGALVKPATTATDDDGANPNDVTLADNTFYKWRARAVDGAGLKGPWSAEQRFFYNPHNDLPTAPQLASPLNLGAVASLTPTLTTDDATDLDDAALTYRFQVFADAALAVQTADSGFLASGGNGSTSWTLAAPLGENVTYWWRVTARDPHAAATSSTVRSFFVNSVNSAPTTPVIVGPLDASIVTLLAPTLEIDNATDVDGDALSYFFEIDSAADFSSPAYQGAAVAEGAGTTTWTTATLVENVLWHWRVRALDGITESPWAAGTFFVNTVNDPPLAPAILGPADGASVQAEDALLSVSNTTDPDGTVASYRFTLYEDPAMTSVLAASGDVSEGAGTTSWNPGLDAEDTDREFWWDAVAVDELGAVSAAAASSFRTNVEPPADGGGGCGCSLAPRSTRDPLAILGFAGLALIFLRRQRGARG